jgi:hypothetical protein
VKVQIGCFYGPPETGPSREWLRVNRGPRTEWGERARVKEGTMG